MDKEQTLLNEMNAIARAARAAAAQLRESDSDTRNQAISAAAQAIRADSDSILEANAEDEAKARNLSPPLRDRLHLDQARIEAMARTLEEVALLPESVGRELARWKRPNGLDIARVTTPIGVIAMIYESRPNVTVDAAALCLKSANACILRGGSQAAQSSAAIHAALVRGLTGARLPSTCVQLVTTTDRRTVGLILEGLDGAIDLVIPRGGKELVARVKQEARVPVLGHLEGVCHIYVHEDAEVEMSRKLVINSKMRRTGICGAAETLLIDRTVLTSHCLPILSDLTKAGCEIRGDEAIRTIFPSSVAATEDDWRTEYLDAIIAVKAVSGLEQAIQHIESYGTHHSESIITGNIEAAERFLEAINSAIVMWNASTQFADGNEFGMGAEIGIGTGKLHARGPVGAEQLTTFKYVVRGNGQERR